MVEHVTTIDPGDELAAQLSASLEAAIAQARETLRSHRPRHLEAWEQLSADQQRGLDLLCQAGFSGGASALEHDEPRYSAASRREPPRCEDCAVAHKVIQLVDEIRLALQNRSNPGVVEHAIVTALRVGWLAAFLAGADTRRDARLGEMIRHKGHEGGKLSPSRENASRSLPAAARRYHSEYPSLSWPKVKGKLAERFDVTKRHVERVCSAVADELWPNRTKRPRPSQRV